MHRPSPNEIMIRSPIITPDLYLTTLLIPPGAPQVKRLRIFEFILAGIGWTLLISTHDQTDVRPARHAFVEFTALRRPFFVDGVFLLGTRETFSWAATCSIILMLSAAVAVSSGRRGVGAQAQRRPKKRKRRNVKPFMVVLMH